MATAKINRKKLYHEARPSHQLFKSRDVFANPYWIGNVLFRKAGVGSDWSCRLLILHHRRTRLVGRYSSGTNSSFIQYFSVGGEPFSFTTHTIGTEGSQFQHPALPALQMVSLLVPINTGDRLNHGFWILIRNRIVCHVAAHTATHQTNGQAFFAADQ